MSLLREIHTVIASDGDVISALRKCKILAARLRSDELARWVDFELDGFPASQPTPEYRRLSTNCLANFTNGYWRVDNYQVPGFGLPEDMREGLSRPHEFRDGITAATVFSQKGARINYPELAVIIERYGVLYPEYGCTLAWKVIPATERPVSVFNRKTWAALVTEFAITFGELKLDGRQRQRAEAQRYP
jgi:hypothetical protein